MTKVNPDSIPRYAEPDPESERTPFEWMDLCAHCGACERLYVTFVDNREHVGWREDMARILDCGECDQWEEY